MLQVLCIYLFIRCINFVLLLVVLFSNKLVSLLFVFCSVYLDPTLGEDWWHTFDHRLIFNTGPVDCFSFLPAIRDWFNKCHIMNVSGLGDVIYKRSFAV